MIQHNDFTTMNCLNQLLVNLMVGVKEGCETWRKWSLYKVCSVCLICKIHRSVSRSKSFFSCLTENHVYQCCFRPVMKSKPQREQCFSSRLPDQIIYIYLKESCFGPSQPVRLKTGHFPQKAGRPRWLSALRSATRAKRVCNYSSR